MSGTLDRYVAETTHEDLPFRMNLELNVVDQDTIAELGKYAEGPEREEFALEALKIGVLTLRRAVATMDADFVKRETDRLLTSLGKQLQTHAEHAKQRIEDSLGTYFDPENGQFTQRVKQLSSSDGEVGKMIRSLVEGEDSQLAKTMVSHIGQTSPLFRMLDPQQANGLLGTLKKLVETELKQQSERFTSEFSLDNAESALCRMLRELTGKHGDFTNNMKLKIDEVVKEFSLDEENSALSRLVKKVNTAQEIITKEFSLDNDQSSLKKMQNHLETILGAHIKSAADFQEEVKLALRELVTTRRVEARGTLHGATFEGAVLEFLAQDCNPRGELVENTSDRVGLIKSCKIGDAVIELGCDSAAAGARIAVEAKEDSSYTLSSAREEIEKARKNRDAQLGIFIFSARSAPELCEPLRRIGNDLLVVWDAENPATDSHFKAALEIARALCVRSSQAKEHQEFDFAKIDKSILDIERHVQNLDKIRTSAETIRSSSDKILERVRIDQEALDRQLAVLRDCLGDLKATLGTADTEATAECES